jgi:hypothetical protein
MHARNCGAPETRGQWSELKMRRVARRRAEQLRARADKGGVHRHATRTRSEVRSAAWSQHENPSKAGQLRLTLAALKVLLGKKQATARSPPSPLPLPTR